MISLIISAVRFLINFLSRAQGMMAQELNTTRGMLKKLRNTDETKQLPNKPPMPEMKMRVHGIEEALNELERVKVSAEQVLLPQLKGHAVSLCNDLIKNSPPYINGTNGVGGSPQALQSGRLMTEKQIKSIFKPTQSMLFGHLVMARDWEATATYNWTPTSEGMKKDIDNQNWKGVYQRFAARGWKADQSQIVDKPTPQLHKDARTSDGRTKKTYYVRRKEAIQNYIRQAQQAVGTLLSGWVEARNQIGAKPADGSNVNAPSLGKGSGYAQVRRSGRESSVTITNTLGDANGIVTKSGLLQQLLYRRRILMTNTIKKAVDNAIKAATAKTKSPSPTK